MVFRFKPLATAIGLVSLVHFPSLMAANNDWIKGVAIDGNVKLKANYEKSYFQNGIYVNNSRSDIVLNNAQLGFTGKVHEWSTARLSFLYQKNEVDPLQVDETFMTLGNLKVLPVYLKMGQWYLPFGRDDALFISHTTTYDMAGPLRQAALLGFEGGGVYGSAYGYNGQTQEDNNNKIDHYGATLGFAKESDDMSIDVNVNYLSDFGDVSNFLINKTNAGKGWTGYKYVGGISGYVHLKAGPITVVGEYISALDKFEPTFLPFQKTAKTPIVGAEPSAWYAGLGYTLKMGGRETTFAVGYQATDESRDLGIQPLNGRHLQPKKRYLACLSVVPVDNTTISLEYKHDTDYNKEDDANGTGKSTDAVALQMSVNF